MFVIKDIADVILNFLVIKSLLGMSERRERFVVIVVIHNLWRSERWRSRRESTSDSICLHCVGGARHHVHGLLGWSRAESVVQRLDRTRLLRSVCQKFRLHFVFNVRRCAFVCQHYYTHMFVFIFVGSNFSTCWRTNAASVKRWASGFTTVRFCFNCCQIQHIQRLFCSILCRAIHARFVHARD
jgi:hypothetical protein